MPNHKKPPHLKGIDGSRHAGKPDDAIRYPTLEHVPPHPDWLVNFHAQQEWKRLGPILAANKLLTEVSLSSLANLCAMYGSMVTTWSAGGVPNAALLSQYRQLANEFGLTPLSQGRIKAPNDAPSTNPFSNNGRREAA